MMDWKGGNWIVKDHKVVIKIGPLTAAPPCVNYWRNGSKQPFISNSFYNNSGITTLSKKDKALNRPSVKVLKTKPSTPSGGNIVLTPGAHFASVYRTVPSNAQFLDKNTNNLSYWNKTKDKKVLHNKRHKDNFNLQQYGVRNLIYEDR